MTRRWAARLDTQTRQAALAPAQKQVAAPMSSPAEEGRSAREEKVGRGGERQLNRRCSVGPRPNGECGAALTWPTFVDRW